MKMRSPGICTPLLVELSPFQRFLACKSSAPIRATSTLEEIPTE